MYSIKEINKDELRSSCAEILGEIFRGNPEGFWNAHCATTTLEQQCMQVSVLLFAKGIDQWDGRIQTQVDIVRMAARAYLFGTSIVRPDKKAA